MMKYEQFVNFLQTREKGNDNNNIVSFYNRNKVSITIKNLYYLQQENNRLRFRNIIIM